MEKVLKYHSPLKAFAFIVFISLCWTNVAAYFWWMSDDQKITLQSSDPFDVETEKEEQKVEEQKDEKRLNDYSTQILFLTNLTHASNWQTSNYQALHHPDVATPPPKFSFLLA